jgi:hypothetical protein
VASLSGHGVGGTAYCGLKKGTAPYANGIAQGDERSTPDALAPSTSNREVERITAWPPRGRGTSQRH